MSNGSGSGKDAVVSSSPDVEAGDTDTYLLAHAGLRPRLLAYARALVGDPARAVDLVAEAHFLTWRRVRSGARLDDLAAVLHATVRDLAATGGATPDGILPGVVRAPAPVRRVPGVELLRGVLERLPDRWVLALWLAEAADEPDDVIAPRIGTRSPAATGLLLDRAHDGLREAFLRDQPGTPLDPACVTRWARIPDQVRGAGTAGQAQALAAHTARCEDCRARLALLRQADGRLSSLTGPALLMLRQSGAPRSLATDVVDVAHRAGRTGAHPRGSPAAGTGAALSSVPRRVRRALLLLRRNALAVTAGVAAFAVVGATVAVGAVLSGDGDTAARSPARHQAAGAPRRAEVPEVTPGPGPTGSAPVLKTTDGASAATGMASAWRASASPHPTTPPVTSPGPRLPTPPSLVTSAVPVPPPHTATTVQPLPPTLMTPVRKPSLPASTATDTPAQPSAPAVTASVPVPPASMAPTAGPTTAPSDPTTPSDPNPMPSKPPTTPAPRTPAPSNTDPGAAPSTGPAVEPSGTAGAGAGVSPDAGATSAPAPASGDPSPTTGSGS